MPSYEDEACPIATKTREKQGIAAGTGLEQSAAVALSHGMFIQAGAGIAHPE